MSRRLFISLDIEERTLAGNLREFQEGLEKYGRSSPTDPKNFHITMNFIGDVEEDRVEDIIGDLKDVNAPSFKFTVKGVGVFPKPEFIKVVWAGVDEGCSELNALAEDIRSSIDPDLVQDRDFSPHITLLRVKKIGREDKDELQKVIMQNEDKVFGAQQAKCFSLKESVLTENGAKHRNIQDFDLR